MNKIINIITCILCINLFFSFCYAQNDDSGQPSFNESTESQVNLESLKVDIKNEVIIYGFTTKDETSISIKVETESGFKVTDLEVFNTSFNSGGSNYSYKLKYNHYVLLKGLKPNTTYNIYNLIRNSNEVLLLKVNTSNNQTNNGSYNLENITITNETNGYLGADSKSFKFVNKIENICYDYNLNQEICDQAQEAKDEIGSIYSPGQENTNQLISSFMNNKPLFYGNIILIFLLIILEIYYLATMQNSYGIVFDSITHRFINGAIVRIFSEETKKLLETKVTDNQGKYTFLVKPGHYYLEVNKENYRFPSKIIVGKDTQNYSNLYRGEIIKIFRNNILLAPNIAVDKISSSLEDKDDVTQLKPNVFIKMKTFFFKKLRIYLLIIITLANLGVIVFSYVPSLIAILGLIGVIWILEAIAIVKKGYR